MGLAYQQSGLLKSKKMCFTVAAHHYYAHLGNDYLLGDLNYLFDRNFLNDLPSQGSRDC